MEHPRAVIRQEGEKLADEYDMAFFETSVKENESIDEAFDCIVKEIKKDSCRDELYISEITAIKCR